MPNAPLLIRSLTMFLLLGLLLAACGPNQRERDLAAANEALRADVSELERRNSDLSERLSAADEAANETAERIARLGAERDAALAEVDDTAERTARLEAERDAALAEVDEAAQRIAELEEERDALRASVEQQQAEATSGEPAPGNAKGTSSEDGDGAAAGSMEATNEVSEGAGTVEEAVVQPPGEERVRRVEMTASMEGTFTEGTSTEGTATDAGDHQLERLRERLDSALAERAELEEALEAARQRTTELETSLISSLADKANVEHELEVTRSRLIELGSRSSTLDEELGETRVELTDAQERAGELTTRLGELLEREAGLQQTTQAQRDELAEVKRALEETQNEVALLTGARGIYTVQPGDSLSSVAAFFYRAGHRWPDILEANRNLIDHPDLIFTGMVLIIPN